MGKESYSVGKIGGSNMHQLDEVQSLIGNHLIKLPEKQVLVVSAFAGVTNTLVAAIEHIINQGKSAEEVGNAFESAQELLALQIDKNPLTKATKPYSRPKIQERIDLEFQRIKDILASFEGKNLRTTNKKALPVRDAIIGFGEDTAAIIAAAHCKAHDIPVYYPGAVKASSEGSDMHSEVQRGFETNLSGLSRSAKDHVLMFGGHVRDLPGGIIEAIGRSYSDTTAVDLAKALENKGHRVNEVVFWKDVEALMTADPRLLNLDKSQPLKVPDISIREALEAARSGSSLLHVQALELAEQLGINLRLKKLQEPDSEGTRYSNNEVITGRPFKTMVRHPHDTLTLDITQVAGQAGVVQYFSKIFAEQGISVNDIATEGNSITFTVPLPRDESDREGLRQRIRNLQGALQSIEIGDARYKIDGQWRQDSLEHLSVVGSELANRPGILGLLCTTLSAHGINILSVGHTTQQHRISFYVAKNDAERAYKVLHMHFIDRDEKVMQRVRDETHRLIESTARW
jgi:aspartate kinase